VPAPGFFNAPFYQVPPNFPQAVYNPGYNPLLPYVEEAPSDAEGGGEYFHGSEYYYAPFQRQASTRRSKRPQVKKLRYRNAVIMP
jgi:hypothetical protein